MDPKTTCLLPIAYCPLHFLVVTTREEETQGLITGHMNPRTTGNNCPFSRAGLRTAATKELLILGNSRIWQLPAPRLLANCKQIALHCIEKFEEEIYASSDYFHVGFAKKSGDVQSAEEIEDLEEQTIISPVRQWSDLI